jgi:microcin C transport system permease protein
MDTRIIDRVAEVARTATEVVRAAKDIPVPAITVPPSGWLAAVRRRLHMNPITRRRWENFKANRRGYWSFWIFLGLLLLTGIAEFIANDKPLLARYKGELLVPVLVDYPEQKFGGFLAVTDYKDPVIQEEIEQNGWILWPPVRYSYHSINKDYPRLKSESGQCLGFPSPPHWATSKQMCDVPADQIARYTATGNRNWFGTDDQGRDVLARLIYGFRISVMFGLLLTIFSSIIGITAGAVQGYFGGKVDLFFQRFLEIWSSIPSLFVLIIVSSVLTPGFWTLLGVLLLFRCPHHVQASATERHGRDHHIPAVQALRRHHRAHGA